MTSNYRDGNLIQGQAVPRVLGPTINLTADNQVVDPGIQEVILITSDNATATNRTFTVAASVIGAGHKLTFIWQSTNKGQLQDTGIQKLTADWLPDAIGDSVSLVWDGTNWCETGRATATDIPTIPLATGSTLIGVAGLASAVAISHYVKFAGTYTTLGGSATEAQTLTGVATTDVVLATLKTKGATPRTILTTANTLNTITYVFSGDPSTDHVVSYMVLRPSS